MASEDTCEQNEGGRREESQWERKPRVPMLYGEPFQGKRSQGPDCESECLLNVTSECHSYQKSVKDQQLQRSPSLGCVVGIHIQ